MWQEVGNRKAKTINFIMCFIVVMFVTGCGRVGEKTASMSPICAGMVLLAGLLVPKKVLKSYKKFLYKKGLHKKAKITK